jgi:alkylation response protein AidB-like acyl-CoA dehydrogenase
MPQHDLKSKRTWILICPRSSAFLKESIDGLLTDSYDFDARKKYQKEKGGWSKAVWGKLAEQGLLGLPFAEADGGFGAGAVETMIVMEALGKALVLEPYLATVVIGGGFLRHGGSAEQKAAHIPGIIDGSKTFAFRASSRRTRATISAMSQPPPRRRARDGSSTARNSSCSNGENADTLIVTARTKGGSATRPASAYSSCRPTPRASPAKAIRPQDGLHAARHHLHRRRGRSGVPRSAIPRTASPWFERVVDEARTAMCAEAVGAMG